MASLVWRPAAGSHTRSGTRLAWFPPSSSINPYHELLYGHLRELGVEVDRNAEFSLRWLWRARRRVHVLHFHWRPDRYYDWPEDWDCAHPPLVLRRPLAWLKLAGFGLRLAAARLFGYRIAWTMHEVLAKGSSSRRLDLAGAHLLSRAAHVVMTHDGPTAERARAEIGPAVEPLHVVPHGSFIGVYPPGRPRELARRELGVNGAEVVFLAFGIVRDEKRLDVLIDAFRALDRDDVALVVAGEVRDEAGWRRVEERAAPDPRIKLRPGAVPDEAVAELFGACDVAAFARTNGWTSGSLILALSLGLPVVAADREAYVTLTNGEEAAWLFEGDSVESLRDGLERAAVDRAELARKAAAARRLAQRLRWSETAELTHALLLGAEPVEPVTSPIASAPAG